MVGRRDSRGEGSDQGDTVKASAARRARIATVAAHLADEGLGAALFEDVEGRRDQNVRYLTGQPGDGLLVISADGGAFLAAWDINLARTMAEGVDVFSYTDFSRQPKNALAAALKHLGVEEGSRIELPSTTSQPRYKDFVASFPRYELVCRDGGVDAFVRSLRAVKDGEERALYRRAAAITDSIMDEVESALRSGRVSTELDVALLIERASRSAGCEGTGFETLAAGNMRSWGIHAFPTYGGGLFGSEGMSILDFGVKLEGYTTDVTMTFLRGRIGAERERMVDLVQRAYDECVAACGPGVSVRSIAARADAIFADAGYSMPHSLGHGIGLDAHEEPFLRNRDDCTDVLVPGNVITLEPGLYHPELGGVRLENDIIVGESGAEVITASRIVRL
jgi:Xaa-Pro dipeptidase